MIEYGMLAVVFLLPWQTVWIIREGSIGTGGGIWQYGVLRIYALECLIALIFFLVCVYGMNWIIKRGIVGSLRTWSSSKFFLFDVAVLLFCIWAGISIAWSDEKIVSLFSWGRICEGVLLFFLLRTIQLRFTMLTVVWMCAATIQALFGIEQFVFQQIQANSLLGIAGHLPGNLGDSVVEGINTRWLRAYGAFPHPNIFGAYLAISFVWCLIAQKLFQKKWQWIILMVCGVLIAVALFFTFSRGAWGGLMVGLCASGLLWFFSRSSRSVTRERGVISPVLVTVCMSALVVLFLSSFFVDEIKGRIGFAPSRLEQQSVSQRITSIARARPLLEQVWTRGTGIGNFTSGLFQYEKRHGTEEPWYTYQPLHNVPLMIFAELGVVGIVLACIALLLFFCVFFASRLSPLAFAFVGIFIIAGSVDHFFWTIPVGIFFVGSMAGIMTSTYQYKDVHE